MPIPSMMRVLLLTCLPVNSPRVVTANGQALMVVFPGTWRTFKRGSPGMWHKKETGQSSPAKFSRGNE